MENVVNSIDTGKSKFDKECASGEYPILGSTSVIGYDDEYDYEGDFILTARVGANAGSLYRHAGKVKISDNTVFIQASENIDFLYHLLTWFDIKKLSFGTGQPLVKASELKNLELMMPKDINEQKQIGVYFKNLDHTITLHQCKCFQDHTGVFDAQIRSDSAYYTATWEQRKLNEYLKVSKLKNKDEIFGKEDVLSVSGDYGVVNQIEFQGRSFAGVSVAPYGVVDTGDVIYTKSPLKANPYGIIKTNKGKPGIVSTLYAVYKPLENTCPEFVQLYFEQDSRLNKYMHPLVNKGAKNDMKVSDENALKGEVIFPSKEEQIRITECFAKIDNVITLHQRTCFAHII